VTAAVLDSGALIAIDRRDRAVGAILRVLHQEGIPLHTSAGAVAQVWRNGSRQATLARVLAGVDVSAINHAAALRVGELLRTSRTTDLVDAHVALLVSAGDRVLTSDPSDLDALLKTRRIKANVIRV
jgi:hypothetical protein